MLATDTARRGGGARGRRPAGEARLPAYAFGERYAIVEPEGRSPGYRASALGSTLPLASSTPVQSPPLLSSKSGIHALAFAAALSTASAAGTASGQPTLPKLSVRRAPDAADCPDAAALTASVERQMKRPALEPLEPRDPPAPTPEGQAEAGLIDVHVLRSQGGYSATVQANGRTRQISDPGPTCAGLAEALAITLAILLDSEETPPPPPARTAEPPVPAPTPSAPAPALRASLSPPLPSPAPARSTSLLVTPGVAGTAGLVGPLTLGFTGDVELHLPPSLSLGAGMFWIPTRSIDFAKGRVDVYQVAGVLRGCMDVLGSPGSPDSPESARAALCAHAAAGALHGEGVGYFEPGSATRPWFAFGVGAVVEGPIWKRLGWSARASLMIPVVKESFSIENVGGQPEVTAFEPSRMGVVVSVGPRVTIW